MPVWRVYHFKRDLPVDPKLSGALVFQPKSLIHNLTAAQGPIESAPKAMRCSQCAPVAVFYFFTSRFWERHTEPFQVP